MVKVFDRAKNKDEHSKSWYVYLVFVVLSGCGIVTKLNPPYQESTRIPTSIFLVNQPNESTSHVQAGSVQVPSAPINNNPMMRLKPLKNSLHPKWKLWTEMDTDEQQKALKEAGKYITKYGKLITGPNQKDKKHGSCDFDNKIGSTGHKLCLPKPPADEPCYFFSFGINDNPSYDRELATEWGCKGFAGDPTVGHPSKLHDLVTFHNIGATVLMDNEERKINKGGAEDWWLTSMPKLRWFLGIEHINVMKLDCEGCEVALARDIIREDPNFLYNVDQINLETHVSRTWIDSQEHVYYFGMNFALLEEAGFELEWSSIFGCSKRHEITGCVPEMEEFGFPCGYKDWPGHPNVVLGRSCHDFLFRRNKIIEPIVPTQE